MKNTLLFFASALALSAAETNSVLIRNVTVHPITAPEIQNSAVLVINGKIVDIGPRSQRGARAWWMAMGCIFIRG